MKARFSFIRFEILKAWRFQQPGSLLGCLDLRPHLCQAQGVARHGGRDVVLESWVDPIPGGRGREENEEEGTRLTISGLEVYVGSMGLGVQWDTVNWE